MVNKKEIIGAKDKNENEVEQKYFSEYERGLLALAYKNKDCLLELQQVITADYFLYRPHKIIYTALSILLKDSKINKIDMDSLLIQCKELGIKEYLTNLDYLVILTQGGQDKDNFQFYLEKVKNAYIKYSLHCILDTFKLLVEKNAKDKDSNLTGSKLLNELSGELINLNSSNSIGKGVAFSEVVRDFVIDRARNPQQVMGLETGFPTLDTLINGLLPGTLTVISAPAKTGKSTVIMNIANHVALDIKHPVPVLIISTEMSSNEDLSRHIAMRSLIEERKIINGLAYNDPRLKIILDKVIDEIEKCKIYHEYLPYFNSQSVCNIINYYKIKYNIGIAMFDYIKMETADSDGNNKYKREDQVLGDITTALKNVAGTLNIPIVTACQINTRTGIVADSDRIIRYCNTLLEFRSKTMEELAEQDYHKYGTHWLQVYSTRSGGNGKIPIRFWRKCLKLQEAEVFESTDEQTDPTEELLTTPEEWGRLQEDSLTIDYISNTISEKDLHDLNMEEEDE